MRKIHLLFITILIEGYVVLACELIAIRQLIPFVGSGTEVIAIVISAVLMPLAIGYHFGGMTVARLRRKKQICSIRKVLLRNLISALIVLGLGLSYVFMELFFTVLEVAGVQHRMAQTFVYVMLFLVGPVFMLGQTVPLVSNYFSRKNLSQVTGHMLFFSTIGSFFGSIFTTIVLMSIIGVHHTVIVTMALLAGLTVMLSRRMLSYETLLAGISLAAVVGLNQSSTMSALNIVSNNAYNTVIINDVKDEPGSRILIANRSYSSKISDDPNHQFDYWKYIQRHFIDPVMDGSQPPKKILIIGAGGFAIGESDTHNHYTYIDIDPALKEVSERHFLKRKLSDNKKFIPMSARAFLMQNKDKYDLILIDAFTNKHSIPLECTTREFLLAVKAHLKTGGIVLVNVLSSPTFNERFTVRYHNTFASVFPQFSRQVLGDFNAWDADTSKIKKQHNIIYSYHDSPFTGDMTIYTDDLNTFSLDR